MGVTGAGKSAVARVVAERRGAVFADADDFHSAGNVAKMAAGVPLDDADREPWLAALNRWLRSEHAAGRAAVLACSALKARYRDRLREGLPSVAFVHLMVPRAVLLQRLEGRAHFMPSALLESQLATLEPLALGERGIAVDGSQSLDAVVEEILHELS